MKPYHEADGVTLYCGDCREIPAWLDADVLLTDPPYGIAWSRGVHAARGSKASDGICGDEDTAVRDWVVGTWGDKPGVVFGSLYVAPPPNLRHVCVWEKPADAGVVGSTTGFRRDVEGVYLTGRWRAIPASRGSVLRSLARSSGNPSSPAGRTGHPHAKPVDLLIQLMGFLPFGVVADPFAGSGSTLVAALHVGRRAVGVEAEERYCEVAARRLDQGVLDLGAA